VIVLGLIAAGVVFSLFTAMMYVIYKANKDHRDL